jgi:hypothetical protein
MKNLATGLIDAVRAVAILGLVLVNMGYSPIPSSNGDARASLGIWKCRWVGAVCPATCLAGKAVSVPYPPFLVVINDDCDVLAPGLALKECQLGGCRWCDDTSGAALKCEGTVRAGTVPGTVAGVSVCWCGHGC